MRNYIFVLVGFFYPLLSPRIGAAEPVHATPHRIEFGAQVAPTIVNLGGEDASGELVKVAPRLSFAVGGVFGVRIHELIAARSELVLIRKGSDTEIDGMRLRTYMFDYIQVPLLVQFDIPLRHRIRPYVSGGVGMSWLLDARSKEEDGSIRERDNIRSTDIGVLLGGGAAVPFSWGILSLELRYDHGLVTIDDAGDGDIVQTRAFSFLLGYRFGVLPFKSP
jgi:hypothetical protein